VTDDVAIFPTPGRRVAGCDSGRAALGLDCCGARTDIGAMPRAVDPPRAPPRPTRPVQTARLEV